MPKCIFPAIFAHEQEGGYSIHFPDIDGCFTCGDSLEDAMEMAKDALSLMLVQLEDEHADIPIPSSLDELSITEGEFSAMIKADTNKD